MSSVSDAELIEAVKRACARSAAVVHEEMKQGLNSLATIASTASWVGLFGTLLGMADSFKGVGAEKSAIMAAITQSLSESLMPAAMGLLVAISASWFYKYLSGEMESFDLEMENASLELISHLAIYIRRRNVD
jgi:biopolymer transport protein TolQ